MDILELPTNVKYNKIPQFTSLKFFDVEFRYKKLICIFNFLLDCLSCSQIYAKRKIDGEPTFGV